MNRIWESVLILVLIFVMFRFIFPEMVVGPVRSQPTSAGAVNADDQPR